jgi:hypothetical protein
MIWRKAGRRHIAAAFGFGKVFFASEEKSFPLIGPTAWKYGICAGRRLGQARALA